LKLKEWDPVSVAIMPQRCIVDGCDSVYGKGNIFREKYFSQIAI
jgi:hypothetical protein